MDEFIKYRSFNDKALALQLYDKLADDGLAVKWEDSEGFFDVSFVNDEFMNIYYVKLRQQDFERADQVLERSTIILAEKPVDDYYLYSFSNEELIDVLQKKDEWNEFDNYWATKILEQRGIAFEPSQLLEMKNERIAELKEPWKVSSLWRVSSLAIPLVAIVFLNIILSAGTILVGLYIILSKKTLPDGQRVMAFTPRDRLFGKIFCLMGILITAYILYRYYEYSNY
jgi:hypothetical protein